MPYGVLHDSQKHWYTLVRQLQYDLVISMPFDYGLLLVFVLCAEHTT